MKMRGTMPQLLIVAGFLTVLCLTALPPIGSQEPAVPHAGGGRAANAQAGQADLSKDIEKLKEEIRQLREKQQVQMRQLKMHLTLGSQVELQNQDYAQARSGFHTKLLRKGPSPQGWSRTQPPVGVTE